MATASLANRTTTGWRRSALPSSGPLARSSRASPRDLIEAATAHPTKHPPIATDRGRFAVSSRRHACWLERLRHPASIAQIGHAGHPPSPPRREPSCRPVAHQLTDTCRTSPDGGHAVLTASLPNRPLMGQGLASLGSACGRRWRAVLGLPVGRRDPAVGNPADSSRRGPLTT